LNRQEKTAVINRVHEKLKKSSFSVVTDYRGLKVSDMEALRKGLRDSEAEIQVVKNTLLDLAARETSHASLTSYFEGTTALAVSYGDPVAPAKILAKFADDHAAFVIKAGVLDGKTLTPAEIVALSELPPREALLGQLLSVMNAVPTGLVRVLNGVPLKMLYALQAVAEQKENA